MRLGHRDIGIVFGLLGAAALLGVTWLIRPPFVARSMGVAGAAGLLAFVLAMFAVSMRLELVARKKQRSAPPSTAPPSLPPSASPSASPSLPPSLPRAAPPAVMPVVKALVGTSSGSSGCPTCAAF